MRLLDDHSKAFAAALVAALLVLGASATARAESGRFNLHLDLGGALPLSGDISEPTTAAGFGFYGSAAIDWQIVSPFAIQLRYGLSYFPLGKDTVVADDAPQFVTDHAFQLGGRFRILDNREGYASGDPHGDIWGNLWVDAHVGLHQFWNETRFGLDAAVGYEYSLLRPLQVGLFVRIAYVFAGGQAGETADMYLTGGVSFSIELGHAAAADRDHDGLSDERETVEYHTNPDDPDTDHDGLQDGVEVEGHTDPTNADTDGDGAQDGREDANHDGERQATESDPRVADTDSGGAPDGWEIEHHRNPTNPADDDNDHDHVIDHRDQCLDTAAGVHVDERGCAILEHELVLEGIEFDVDSATIREASFPILDGAIRLLRDNPTVHVEVQGHTDSTGSRRHNQQLSQARAESVMQYLVAHGIPAERLTARGYGSTHPRGPNDTEEGRARNRRIEFVRQD